MKAFFFSKVTIAIKIKMAIIGASILMMDSFEVLRLTIASALRNANVNHVKRLPRVNILNTFRYETVWLWRPWVFFSFFFSFFFGWTNQLLFTFCSSLRWLRFVGSRRLTAFTLPLLPGFVPLKGYVVNALVIFDRFKLKIVYQSPQTIFCLFFPFFFF